MRGLLPPVHPLPVPPIPDLPPLVLQAVFFIALLITASVFDIRSRIIPNSVCIGIALVGLLYFSPVNLLGILATLPLFLAALCKGGGIGGGDIKLMAACGLVLGFANGVAGLCLGLACMLLFYGANQIAGGLGICKKLPKGVPLPMVPFLSLGFTAVYIMNFAGL